MASALVHRLSTMQQQHHNCIEMDYRLEDNRDASFWKYKNNIASLHCVYIYKSWQHIQQYLSVSCTLCASALKRQSMWQRHCHHHVTHSYYPSRKQTGICGS
ncbi:hypothetical protein GDO78_006957 [Eleutherodactylus coqui]|uniref:Uncharacterized protein n=1 Tax=Eleutherodactylus coqui TaxID=57060 RepID=A0A8J6FGB2_ELECQ|nr:hypothetical protein GDO78_006957 [Eleutherodactylus coqui]